MGYRGKVSTNKFPRKKTSIKNIFTKKRPKDRINVLHGKATKKNSKKISIINHFQKELSQRSYQCGTQES